MSTIVAEDKIKDPEFKWGKKRGVGGKNKDIQFYESFTYDGVEYSLHDCVYLHKEGEPEPYIGKLIKIWEHSEKSKKVKVQWFFRPSEILYYLGEGRVQENEIFLASGEGSGLANVNPLEAIAGKCNVVCVSKDSRNPQPSPEELQMADYVFHRTFDVGKCAVMNNIGEKVGGLEVKFIFNRKQSDAAIATSKHDSEPKNAITSNEENPELYGKSPPVGLNVGSHLKRNHLCEEDGRSSKELLVKQESLPGEVVLDSIDNVDCSKRTTSNVKGCISSNKIMRSEVENGNPKDNKAPLYNDELKCDEIPKDHVAYEDRPFNRTRIENSPSLVEGKSMGSSVKSLMTSSSSKEKGETKRSRDSILLDKGAKSPKSSNALDGRPLKKAKFDNHANPLEDKNKKILEKLSFKATNEVKDLPIVTTKGKDITIFGEGALVEEKRFSKEETRDKNISKLSNNRLAKVFMGASTKDARRDEDKEFEVTQRPNDGKSKWFKELPWEEIMKEAHEQGKLVIFQNLDPSYSSGEVEDIVWSAFKEHCTAKIVQRTAISSPHSSQAFAIFKTREGAGIVLRKLADGCLMLSNGRPLVCSVAPPPIFPGKQSTYVGHLSLGKIKSQMNREMRDAVSTSHYSQSNTVEYDMAMEWLLLQSKCEACWKRFYEQQGQQVRKLSANMKSK